MTDKRLKVALIGAGGVVKVKHVDAYAALAKRLCPWVICDPSDANRQWAATHFFDCLYHELYLTRAAIGAPVTRVYAQVANLTCHDITVEDTVLCLLEFANGAMAVLQDCKAFIMAAYESGETRQPVVLK